eukprot:152930-Chlamydomonas_euryale.AAC.1
MCTHAHMHTNAHTRAQTHLACQAVQHCARERRALDRVGARAHLVEQHERTAARCAEDAVNAPHVATESRKVLLQALRVADVGKHLLKPNKPHGAIAPAHAAGAVAVNTVSIVASGTISTVASGTAVAGCRRDVHASLCHEHCKTSRLERHSLAARVGARDGDHMRAARHAQ